MKARKALKIWLWLSALPALLGNIYLMIYWVIDNKEVETWQFILVVLAGCWAMTNILMYVLLIARKDEDYWHEIDALTEKRKEHQKEIDGFIRARQRYIKLFEKLEGIWEDGQAM